MEDCEDEEARLESRYKFLSVNTVEEFLELLATLSSQKRSLETSSFPEAVLSEKSSYLGTTISLSQSC